MQLLLKCEKVSLMIKFLKGPDISLRKSQVSILTLQTSYFISGLQLSVEFADFGSGAVSTGILFIEQCLYIIFLCDIRYVTVYLTNPLIGKYFLVFTTGQQCIYMRKSVFFDNNQQGAPPSFNTEPSVGNNAKYYIYVHFIQQHREIMCIVGYKVILII